MQIKPFVRKVILLTEDKNFGICSRFSHVEVCKAQNINNRLDQLFLDAPTSEMNNRMGVEQHFIEITQANKRDKLKEALCKSIPMNSLLLVESRKAAASVAAFLGESNIDVKLFCDHKTQLQGNNIGTNVVVTAEEFRICGM